WPARELEAWGVCSANAKIQGEAKSKKSLQLPLPSSKRRPCNTPYVVDSSGERGRNRTYNLVIKSHLLCQLSYAPGSERLRSQASPPTPRTPNSRPSCDSPYYHTARRELQYVRERSVHS